jgi:chromosome partitioning protein
MIITGFISGRGGASKSSTSQATHSKLHKQPEKYKPLLVDYDQQGNTSSTYGLDVNACPTMYHVFNGDISIKEAIQHTENGDILCGNASLNKIENLYSADNFLEGVTKLRDELSKLNEYTHILIDTAPKIQGILATQVLISSANVVIPISPDIYSIQGLTRISQVIAPIKASYNPDLRIDGVLLTRYDKRLILNKDLLKAVEQWAAQNDTRVYKAKIRESVAVREAQARRQSLWDYAPFSKPAHDYQAFIKEYLESNHA